MNVLEAQGLKRALSAETRHLLHLCKFSAVGKPVAFPMFPSSQRPFNMAATALEKYVKLLIHTATFVAIKPRSPMLSESQKVSVRFFEV